ncbi:MAG: nucleotide exchange factor GrpE [Bacteroidales bacterium]|nr:nucleotide exchange factor GrpE [Bacteroidales bacterium]MBD5177460.1 nucleotide exchange factor GrpE [Bacteroidales bacterium]
MSDEKDNQNKYYNEQGEDAPEILNDVLEAQQDDSDEVATEEMVGEVNLAEQLTAAREEIEKEKKEYLFLMADFDNFRKRVVREKADLIKNAGEKVLKGILPIVDDFERALAATSDAESMRQGMELIYNKLVKFLADNGVKAMDSTGADFNADLHEAIASIPAPSDDLKGKVIDTTQKGYMINDKVLRHAKVAVGE